MSTHVERVEKEAGYGWTGDAVCVSKEVALDIARQCDALATELTTLKAHNSSQAEAIIQMGSEPQRIAPRFVFELREKHSAAISTLLKAIAGHSCNYKIGHPQATEPCPLCVIEKQGQNFITHAN